MPEGTMVPLIVRMSQSTIGKRADWLQAWAEDEGPCSFTQPHLLSAVPCSEHWGLASSWFPTRAQIAPFPTLLSCLAHCRHFCFLVLTVNTIVFLDCHFQESEKVMGSLSYLSDNFHAFFSQSFNTQYRKGTQETSNKWIVECSNYKMLDRKHKGKPAVCISLWRIETQMAPSLLLNASSKKLSLLAE